jgi:replication factor C subunit 3/5
VYDMIYNVAGSGNTKNEVIIKQSKNHIIIEPNNTNFDRYLIQEVVNEYAKRIPLNIFKSSKKFKVVFIDNIDDLSYYAQTSLRRTMEKYSKTCRFIMWSRSLSKVIDPLRSRSCCFKLQSPSEGDMLEMLLKVSYKENIKMNMNEYNAVIEKADGNIKTALWMLQFKQLGEPHITTYENTIDDIINLILTAKFKNLLVLRDLLYKIMITNITGTQILKDILLKLTAHSTISFTSKTKIIEACAQYEHNLIRGRREIIHIEAFLNEVMVVLRS